MIDYNTPIVIIMYFIFYIIFSIIYYKYSFKNTANKNYKVIKFIIYSLFFIYIINVLKYVLFPIHVDGFMREELIELYTPYQYFIRNLELIPFKGVSIIEFGLNILMTFPIGCFIPVLKRNVSYIKIIWFSLITGIFLESIQILLLFIQGFTVRIISINDVIANLLGVFLGFVFFRFCYKTILILYDRNKHLNIIFKTFIEYISYYNEK